MSNSNRKTMPTSLAVAMSATLAVGAFAATAHADNPFGSNELSSGYMQLASNHSSGEKHEEAKCGEGKCGGDKAEKDGEAKCGEAKCGGDKGDKHANLDGDGDGKVTQEEFMAAHEKMFAEMDKDGDGVLAGDEMKMRHKGREAKCGEGKCGGDKKGKDAEASCGGDKKSKDAEAKCGEGKCGG